jgi:hypothetical protein
MTASPPLFNPAPRIEVRRFGEGRCLVVDDALRDPDAMLALAVARRAEFVDAPFNAYPGLQWTAPDDAHRQLEEFFDRHVRAALGGRRTVKTHARLAITTRPPGALRPMQWLCHRDSAWIAPEHTIAASVLYLFRDPALGGTAFYAPRRPAPEIDRLVHDSSTLDADAFAAKYAWPAGYMQAGNAWFERLGAVEPRWNRMIFYDGRAFHSGDIATPDALRDDPRTGRLTLNGFFTCTRRAGGIASTGPARPGAATPP